MDIGFLSIIHSGLFRLVIVYFIQFFLSTRNNRFLGLILPAYYFISSIVLLINSFSNTYFVEMDRLFHIYLAFIIPNVNTVLFLLIYFVLRKYKFRGDSND